MYALGWQLGLFMMETMRHPKPGTQTVCPYEIHCRYDLPRYHKVWL